jgi:hypothetical protein
LPGCVLPNSGPRGVRSAVLTAIAWSAAWLPRACVNAPRPRFAEPKRPLLENPPPDTACPPTPPPWPPPPPPPPCAPPPAAELPPPPPLEVDVVAAMAALDAPSAMTTMRSDRCGRIKHLDKLVSTSRPLKLTPGSTRFEARNINDGFAQIFAALGIVAIATGAHASCIRHREGELGNSEP